MKAKIWVVNTCIPEPGEGPCFPFVSGVEAEAEAHAEKMLRSEWAGQGPENSRGKRKKYPGDWREANDQLAEFLGAEWGKWEITSHEVDIPPPADFAALIREVTTLALAAAAAQDCNDAGDSEAQNEEWNEALMNLATATDAVTKAIAKIGKPPAAADSREPVGAVMDDGSYIEPWDERLRATGGVPVHERPAVKKYRCSVDYQTESGGNTAVVFVDAVNENEATNLATAKVRADGRRKVMKIDGGSVELAE